MLYCINFFPFSFVVEGQWWKRSEEVKDNDNETLIDEEKSPLTNFNTY